MVIKLYKAEEKWCFDYHCKKYIIEDPDDALGKLSEFFNFSVIYLTVEFHICKSLGYLIKNGYNFYFSGPINILLSLLKVRNISGGFGKKIRMYEYPFGCRTFFITKINKILP
jgi:hypothetical protein